MPVSTKRENFSLNTIIGPHSSVKGDIESAGFTRVDGHLRGDLAAAGRIIVGEDARIRGAVTGTSVTVGGVVYGNILANERVTILSTAVVVGDIITRRIQADEGCLVQGRIQVCENDDRWETAVREHRDAEDIAQALDSHAPRPSAEIRGQAAQVKGQAARKRETDRDEATSEAVDGGNDYCKD
ncbi:MAG: polymer-forming cytoskeletal protein [Spirochaetaceae bacterium]|jgi:cytoskeletal protein CcmA (bactofilin family)|nr:polymer-forming cytoskeletal protein [Spirochaetaceae bacterium]